MHTFILLINLFDWFLFFSNSFLYKQSLILSDEYCTFVLTSNVIRWMFTLIREQCTNTLPPLGVKHELVNGVANSDAGLGLILN